jgi:gamma-glutamyltranspeptidase/glutathione hydrolase
MIAAAAGIVALGTAMARAQEPAPEDATGRTAKPLVSAERHMVAAAHPDAVDAALAMLRSGGSAADAAVAAQLVLNLVEPQSSGIGGGAFALHYDAPSGTLTTYDGRETAPADADGDLFLGPDGAPVPFAQAMVGGRAVGTPGTVALLARLHARHGRLPWADLFAPAIRLARQGFTVGPRLAAMLAGPRGEPLRTYPEARAYFFPDGIALPAGSRRTNPAFADTLEAIAAGGAAAFYEGPIAADIVAAVRTAAGNPGRLSLSDLADYRVIERAPVCRPYRTWRVCGMGPPSSGGIAVAQILGVLEGFDLPARGPNDPASWHLIAEASKLAFADRNRYVADSDFVEVPRDGLLDPAYLAARAREIRPDTTLAPPAAPGVPRGAAREPPASDRARGRPGTSHIAIVDDAGNAVSMTTTIEGAFGAQLMLRGFLLNNELTDFAFAPSRDGRPVANRVAPGKRPRSSMAPTMVFGEGDTLRLVIGSPGGSRIIGYVARTLVAVLDWGMDVQRAIDLGHVVNRNGATEIEAGTDAEALREPLVALGHDVRVRDLNSGLHGIERVAGTLRGGADPRREGIAAGD